MHILELATGDVSLEFAPDEARELFRRMEQVAPVRRSPGALHDLLAVGDAEIIYYHEWDPCLISTSETGRALLRQLVLDASRTEAA